MEGHQQAAGSGVVRCAGMSHGPQLQSAAVSYIIYTRHWLCPGTHSSPAFKQLRVRLVLVIVCWPGAV